MVITCLKHGDNGVNAKARITIKCQSIQCVWFIIKTGSKKSLKCIQFYKYIQEY